ncbi:MAG: hypothetical protein WCQ60_03355 [bacterium]
MTSVLTSHDETVFEGLLRPASLLFFRDNTVDYHHDNEGAILERYFSDIQNLFLKKFGLFASSDQITEQESYKLRSLLEEMIKVKSLMKKGTEEVD